VALAPPGGTPVAEVQMADPMNAPLVVTIPDAPVPAVRGAGADVSAARPGATDARRWRSRPLEVLIEAEMPARARAGQGGNGLTPAQREANLLGRSRRGGD